MNQPLDQDALALSRRQMLLRALVGAGGIGLRALATGLPLSFLAHPQRALAGPLCANPGKAQFVIFQTSGKGDPINANVPGCYADPNIAHSLDPAMAATALSLGGVQTKAAAPWAALPQNVLDRAAFWHVMTNTPVHPKEPDVLKLMGAIRPTEMFPSLLAKQLAPCLGTVQMQPITVGASTPSEGLSFSGAALPIIPPLALRATLLAPTGGLGSLQTLRDQTLTSLRDVLKNGATSAQRSFLDAMVLSQQEVRAIDQSLLATLASITDNSAASQITAALALIRMKVTPVVAIHIPFGGDNHNDKGLATETAETVSGVAAIGQLMAALATAGLADEVTFLSLNVFGRTLGSTNTDGRQHNPNHQVSLAIGKPFKAGVYGGVAPVGNDYGAMPMHSASGVGAVDGDIAAIDTLASFGKTVLGAVGMGTQAINAAIPAGKVIAGALA